MKTDFRMNRRRRVPGVDERGCRIWKVVETPVSIPAAGLAIVICDMWESHWCCGAAERVDAMAGRMNTIVSGARQAGALIVHAPSDTMDFYNGTPARMRALSVPAAQPPAERNVSAPDLPIDDSDGGCDTDRTNGGVNKRVWTRQHPAIEIDESCDAVTDSGLELYSLLRQTSAGHLVIMGVHTNMCILNRSFAIGQMVRWGVDVTLVRDLTDAMYNPARSPYVPHDEGTRLVVEYIEKFWCPTIESSDLVPRQAVARKP